ncbi:MAG TPA: hypothetical protein VIU34_25720, partial [Steroidobacter sp.]
MRKRTRLALFLVVGVVGAMIALYLLKPGLLPQMEQARMNATTEIIERGEYLARAGDCVACHTEINGPAFAGGRPMATPFGNLYVP